MIVQEGHIRYIVVLLFLFLALYFLVRTSEKDHLTNSSFKFSTKR